MESGFRRLDKDELARHCKKPRLHASVVYRINTERFERSDSGFNSCQGHSKKGASLLTAMTFEELVEAGVYEFDGWDDDGEMMWILNEEVAKQVAPEVYWHEINKVDEAILLAIDLGLLVMDIDPETLEVTYTVTDDGEAVL